MRELVDEIPRLGPEIQGQTNETANPDRMRTYTNGGRNSFIIRTYELLDLKSFRMRTCRRDGWGVGEENWFESPRPDDGYGKLY